MVAPIEDDTEGEVNIEDVEEERAKFKKCPGDPTEAELEQHRTSHLPFRAWCKWCVMGRGTGTPHPNTGQTSRIPRIGLDYFYIIEGKDQMKHESELSEGELESKRSDGSVLKLKLILVAFQGCITHVLKKNFCGFKIELKKMHKFSK